MPAPSFTPKTARRTAAPAAPAPRVVKPVLKTEGAAAGLPRFAKPIQPAMRTIAKVAAPVTSPKIIAEKSAATTTTPASPELRTLHSPPKTTPTSVTRSARWENEAHQLASRIQEPTSPVDRVQRGPLRRLQSAPGLGLSPPAHQALEKASLTDSLRQKIESETGYAVGDVTLVRGPTATALTAQHGAKAITTGGVIYLHESIATTDEGVIAHEVAHVIQQRGPGAATDGEDGFTPADPALLQPLGWSTITGAVKSVGRWAGRQIKKGFWFLVRQVSERLETALRNIGDKGVRGFLEENVTSGIKTLLAPVLFLADRFGSAVNGLRHFATMLGDMATLIGQLAKGATRAVLGSIRKMAKMLLGITGGTWSTLINALSFLMGKLRWVVDKISSALDFIFGFLSDAIKAIWDAIKWFVKTIVKLVSSIIGWVWEKIRDMLGFSGGDDDGKGVVSWIQSIIDTVTGWIESIITSVASVVRWLFKLGPLQTLLHLFDFAKTIGDSMSQAADATEKPDGPAKNRNILRDVVLPAIQRGIKAIRFVLKASGEGTCALINGFASGVARFMDALGSIPLIGRLFDWLASGARELGAIASTAVSGVFNFVDSGLVLVSSWVEPILETLVKIVSVAVDAALHLPGLVLGTFWKIIPSWIRDPLKNFIVNTILKRIPILGQLITRLPDIWNKAVAIFKNFVVRVFSKGDLVGAAWGFFKDLLNLIGLPLRMIGEIISNALKSIGQILRHPFDFLINLVRAIGRGLGHFVDHIWKNLYEILSGWMFDKLKLSNLTIPKDFTPAGLFSVVAQILKIDQESIIDIIRERKGDAAAKAVRNAIKAGTKILGWLTTFIDKGPGALWAELQNHISNLWTLVIDKMQAFVLERIIAEGTKWLLTLLDVSGIMPVIKTAMAVYHAVESFIENARRIFDLIHAGFTAITDIAAGNIDSAADRIEGGAIKLLTIAIDFVANQVGLGKIADKIREVISTLRDKVRQAIGKLIDKTFGAIDWAKQKVKNLLWPEKEFDAGGEHHRIFIEKRGGKPVAIINSDPLPLLSFLDDAKANPKIPDTQKALIPATRTKVNKMNELAAEVETATDAEQKMKQDALTQKEEEVADAIQSILAGVTVSNFDERYKLEGMVATYGAMPRQKGDRLTPDHQPQASILLYAAARASMKGRKIQNVVAGGHVEGGLCINLHHIRHVKGRTYGRSPNTTPIDAAVSSNSGNPDAQRRGIVAALRSELTDDANQINSVVSNTGDKATWEDIHDLSLSNPEKTKLIGKVSNQITAGETRMLNQNINALAEVA